MQSAGSAADQALTTTDLRNSGGDTQASSDRFGLPHRLRTPLRVRRPRAGRREQAAHLRPESPGSVPSVRWTASLAAFCVLAGVLLLGAATASASNLRPFVSSFSADLPAGVAVNQQTGNVYVVETNLGVVAAFGPGGGPPSSGVPATSHVITPGSGEPEGVAVDNACFYHVPRLTGGACEAFDPSNGDLYVADARANAVKKLALNALTEEYAVVQEFPFAEPTGVAVDHVGNLYVADYSSEAIPEFNSKGEAAGAVSQAVVAHPGFVAVGAPGVVYVGAHPFEGGHGVAKVEVGVKEELLDGQGNAIAVEAAGHVLVDDRSQISEYSSAGTLLGAYGSGHFTESQGLAVNEETQHAYVSSRTNGANAVAIFGALVTVPDVTTGEATNLTTASGQATLNGSVNPDGVSVSSCEFEYGATTAYGSTAPCTPAPGSATEPVPVSAPITGLTPAVVYHYRLVAANANGSNPGADRTFTAPGVAVDSQWSSKVTATSASLHAEINPNGVSTTYRFEYGTATSYGHTAPIPDGQAGAGSTPISVEVHLSELQPNTTYHYRVVAVGVGTEIGADHIFLTQAATGEGELPDGRRWELVSPPDKLGANLLSIGVEGLIQASIAGDALTYLATSPTESQPEGNAGIVQVLSTRGSAGWGTRDIPIPRTTPEGTRPSLDLQYQFFSSDLSLSIASPDGPFLPSLSPEASEQTAYLRSDYSSEREVCPNAAQKTAGISCYRPLVTGKAGYANVPEGNVFTNEAEGASGGPAFAGASPDLSHVIVQSPLALTAPGKTRTPNEGFYEWTAGKLTFIGEGVHFQAVANDGSRVVFDNPVEEHGHVVPSLLVRDVALGQTLRLDTPQAECVKDATCGDGPQTPEFQTATPDGSKVFFTDGQRLTGDAGTEHTGPDLYECALVVAGGVLRCELHDLTPPGPDKKDANVQGRVLGISSTGSSVYFVATGVLTQAETPLKAKAASGADNLYLRHGDVTTLIAVLNSDDYPDWSVTPQVQPTRVTASGHRLAFTSDASLTGYDNHDVVSGRADEEVFMFDASAGALVCASCNPTGARPAGVEYHQIQTVGEHDPSAGGPGVWLPSQWIAANVPGWTPYAGIPRAAYQSRYLSESGRLFFNSSDALVPQDVNGTEDVYQYEPAGEGGCSTASVTFSARSGACVALISSGKSAEESEFLDASETGEDVFFLTSAQLAATDFDTGVDVYDAHQCSPASPCSPAAAAQPPPCANGDACKPAPSPQPPIFGASGSATFSGSGNAAPPPTATRVKPLTNAQKLVKALRACRKQHRKRRARCERQAKSRYAPHPNAKRSSHPRPGGRR